VAVTLRAQQIDGADLGAEGFLDVVHDDTQRLLEGAGGGDILNDAPQGGQHPPAPGEGGTGARAGFSRAPPQARAVPSPAARHGLSRYGRWGASSSNACRYTSRLKSTTWQTGYQ